MLNINEDADNNVFQINPINFQEFDAVSQEGIPYQSLKDRN